MGKTQTRKGIEIFGILLLILTFALALALVSHHPADPSVNATGEPGGQSANLLGKAGATISAWLLLIMGFTAFLLIIPLVFISVRLIRGGHFRRPFTSYCASFLLFLSAAGIISFSSRSIRWSALPMFAQLPPGGILGDAVKAFFIGNFNSTGALICLCTLLLVGILLLTPLSATEFLAGLWHWFTGIFRRRLKEVPIAEHEGGTDGENGPENDFPADVEGSTPERDPAGATPMEATPTVNPLLIRRKPGATLREPAAAESDGTAPAPAMPRPGSPSARPATASGTGPRPVPAIPRPTPGPRLDPEDEEEETAAHGAEAFKPLPTGIKYKLPSITLLEPSPGGARIQDNELMEKAQQIMAKYAEFGIEGTIEAIHPGPVVTLFEYKPAPGMKYSRLLTLLDDLCLGLKAESIRIDRIPGKSTVGIEVPNSQRDTIFIREVMESPEFQHARSRLTLALGKRINGDVYVTDLAKMPHLLIAGATGQGKSVGLNTMITSILYKASPDEVKFIFIDPKRLELGMYAEIPHLLTPIVTDAKMAANTLIWSVREMEERYKLLAKNAVRDIDSFNRLAAESSHIQPIPYIVMVIDELAELLSVATREVELCLQRLAQMARAVGIHIIMATQRPSVGVVTGVIKANFPSRISFRLLSKYDSNTILDQVGAEHLLGRGDMLFLPPNSSKLLRVHGCLITEDETKRLVESLKSQAPPRFLDLKLGDGEGEEEAVPADSTTGDDPLYEEVSRFVVKQRKASTSILQRRFRVGYGRAARLMDVLQDEGIVGEADGSRPRDVLVPPDYFDSVDETHEGDE